MSVSKGYKSKAAFRIEGNTQGLDSSVYPTSVSDADGEQVALGQCDLIPFKSESMEDQYGFETDETIIGESGHTAHDLISIDPSGGLVLSGTYDGLSALVAAALGFADPAAPSGSTGVTTGTCETSGNGQAVGNIKATAGIFQASDIGKFVKITSGVGEGQVRRISGWTSSSLITVTPDWSVNPESCNFEFALDWEVYYECCNEMKDELWTDIYSSYPTGGVGTASDKLIRRGTLGIDKIVNEFMYRSCFIDSLELNLSSKGAMEVNVSLMPFDHKREASDSSNWNITYNIPSSILSKTDNLERILFSDISELNVAAWHATNGFSGNEQKISGLTLSINNNLSGEDQDAVSAPYRSEPARNGFREITGTFTIPRYTANTWISWKENQTELMGKLKILGSSIASSGSSKEFSIYFHSMKIISVSAPVGGEGILNQTVGFKCFIPSAIPQMGESHHNNVLLSNPYPEIAIKMVNWNPFNVFRDQQAEY